MGKRLDQMVAEMLNISRNKAQNLIKEGYVFVDGKVVDKPSFEAQCNKKITISNHDSYVSRGAYKLIKGLDEFGVKVEGKTVLDMGASTGGFTHVLLERGAKKVFSVDVGNGELDKDLALDNRVVNMEGRDIRSLTKEEVEKAELIVGDLSFISLKNILPHINMLFGKIEMILLFKPQFECGKEIARKYRGIIKDKAVHKKLLKEFEEEIRIYDYVVSNMTFSPIKGGSGNVEYLLHLNGAEQKRFCIDEIVEKGMSL